MLVSRWMSPDILGQFILCWASIEIVSKILLAGLDLLILKDVSIALQTNNTDRFRKTFVTALKFFILAGGVPALSMIFFSESVAQFIYLKPELADGLRALALGAFIFQIGRLFINAVTATRNMKIQLILIGFLEPLLYLLGAALAVQLDNSLGGLCMSQLAANAVILLCAFFYFTKSYPAHNLGIWFREQKMDLSILKNSIPIGTAEISSMFLIKLPMFILGRILPTETASLFMIGHQLAQSFITLRTQFANLVYPVVGLDAHTMDANELKNKLKMFTKQTAIYLLPIFSVIFFFYEPLLQLLKVTNVSQIGFVPILCAALFLFAISANTDFILMMMGRGWKNTIVNLVLILSFGAVYFATTHENDLATPSWIFLFQMIAASATYGVLLKNELNRVSRMVASK